jgi:hypothetical protein
MSNIKKTDAAKKILSEGMEVIWSMSEKQQVEVVQWASTVVERYDHIRRRYPSKLKNAESLPCSKQELELAIKVQLLPHIANGAEADIEQFKRRYIDLASFQHIHSKDKEVLDEALDGTNNASDIASANLHPLYQKYIDLALSEQNSLTDKINKYVEDIKISIALTSGHLIIASP